MLGLALKVSAYTIGSASTLPTADGTASQIYATCHDLLRISSNEAPFLDLTYPILSEIHKVISLTLRQRSLFDHNGKIQLILDQLILSVLDVMKAMVACGQDIKSNRGPGIRLFRRSVATIHDCKDQLFDAFWVCQLPPDVLDSKDSLDQMARLRDWLRPRDETVRTIYANL